MIKSIRNRLRKTPVQNKSTLLKEIDAVDQHVINPLLSSHLLGEGVFGFESVAGKDVNEQFFIVPSFMRKIIGRESHRNYNYLLNDTSNLHCYDIVLSDQSFLPLYTEESTSLLQQFQLLQSNDNEIYVQFLFSKRSDVWQYELIDMYQCFLEGNSYPSTNRLARKFQGKLLTLTDKLSNSDSKRTEIEEISQKILENGYRFELRLILYEENFENVVKIEMEMYEIIKEMDFFNKLQLLKRRNTKKFLYDFINRKFSDISRNQLISESELICMLSDMEIVRENNALEEVIKETEHEASRSIGRIPLIELLPEGEKKNRIIDTSIGGKLESAFDRVGVKNGNKFKISNIQQGSTLQKVDVVIPKGTNYSDIKKNIENIQSAMGIQSISMEISDEPDTVTFLLPCNEREIVYLRKLLENSEFLEFAKNADLPFILGLDILNTPIYEDLTKIIHILVAGQTGGGKSQFLNQIILTLMLMKTPSEMMLYLVDPKKVEFGQFDGFPHVKKVLTDMSKSEELFISLLEEMKKRYEFLSKEGYKKISSYNKSNPKKKIPYIVVVIDELASLKESFPKVESYIQQMGALTRAAGIHLIIATQYPIVDVVSSVIKENLPSQISFRLKSNKSYTTVFGTGVPYTLLGKGDGVAKLEGNTKEFVRFQAPIITTDENEEQEVLDNIKQMYNDESVNGIDVIEFGEPIDKLKRIIASTGETRIAELQKLMSIGINKVHEMVKQLVEEGWLKKENNKYEIIATKQMINDYIKK